MVFQDVLSAEWSHVSMVFHEGGRSSGWSLIMLVFCEGGLSPGSSFTRGIGCDKRLTIEHIVLTCSDFIEITESYFTAKSLRMLFQDISSEKIFFNFLKEINIFGKINTLNHF